MEENRMGVGEPISGWEGLSEEVAFECWGSAAGRLRLECWRKEGEQRQVLSGGFSGERRWKATPVTEAWPARDKCGVRQFGELGGVKSCCCSGAWEILWEMGSHGGFVAVEQRNAVYIFKSHSSCCVNSGLKGMKSRRRPVRGLLQLG